MRDVWRVEMTNSAANLLSAEIQDFLRLGEAAEFDLLDRSMKRGIRPRRGNLRIGGGAEKFVHPARFVRFDVTESHPAD